MKEIYEFDTSKIENPEINTNLYEGRECISNMLQSIKECSSEVTIFVLAYNNLNKTKDCIDSVFKYTKNIDYNLILIDNGSSDGTFEYFKSIEYDKLQIIRINKNLGMAITTFLFDLKWISKYYVTLANDIVVTENWLNNLLTVAKSDKRIGLVNPMSSNVSNFQMYNMKFLDMEDMQRQAKDFNVSDPTKWQERMRIITLGTLYTKECLLAIGWPCFDCGFFHDFADDDISFQIRRAGYKTILAGDTWVHHNHNIFYCEGKDPKKAEESLKLGRENFKTKYFGIDSWSDVSNHVFEYIDDYITMPVTTDNISILGVDVRCGTPILDIQNSIRKYGIMKTENSAFTGEGKYYTDLKTICTGDVICDKIELICSCFKSGYFDFIITGKNINEYNEPEKFINNLYSLLKPGGQLLFSLKNTFDILTLLETMGYDLKYNDTAKHYNVDVFYGLINKMNINIELINCQLYAYNKIINDFANQIIKYANYKYRSEEEILERLMTDKYWFKITKH